jgi:thioredoxin-related protein
MRGLLLIFLFTFTLFAANVDEFAKEMGFERDYKSALAKAKKQDKPLMMVLGADYCPWCRKFERKTLSSKLVNDYINKEVITLIVDKKYDIKTFPKEFQTQITPRVFFINPFTGKDFFQTAGYVKKKEYMQKLQEMKKLYKGR